MEEGSPSLVVAIRVCIGAIEDKNYSGLGSLRSGTQSRIQKRCILCNEGVTQQVGNRRSLIALVKVELKSLGAYEVRIFPVANWSAAVPNIIFTVPAAKMLPTVVKLALPQYAAERVAAHDFGQQALDSVGLLLERAVEPPPSAIAERQFLARIMAVYRDLKL